ncbi:4-alpha-glucanotransferase [Beggiatoa alba]|nr:4-alpha-glucanotransferase [Beggiatoa alba]
MDKQSAGAITGAITNDLFSKRRAGILLHLSSLPGPGEHGIIGHDAYRFVEFLATSGVSIWQMLPLCPTHSDGSPYNALSSHACDPAYICLEWLSDRKLLKHKACSYKLSAHQDALQQAFATFSAKPPAGLQLAYKEFKKDHLLWLEDYSLFMTLRDKYEDLAWPQWPATLRDREPETLQQFITQHAEQLEFHKFCQFIVFSQWYQFKEYANKHGVLLFGDIPIYVAADSADVWANRALFSLRKDGQAAFVAGVPPDYFSATGQRWGNPLYQWDKMQQQDFRWWCDRIKTQYELFDLIRIDHFRALEAYWEIPAENENAIEGRWVNAPGHELLATLQKTFGRLPLIAEDLGTITDKVHQLRHDFMIPGMKVLQFAFDLNPDNHYLPHNHEAFSVIYTGTHDNDTTESWFAALDYKTKDYIDDYLGSKYQHESHAWRLIRVALSSVCQFSIIPMQDILQLAAGHRMNTPGTVDGNWLWRFNWKQLSDDIPGHKLRHLIKLYGRIVR